MTTNGQAARPQSDEEIKTEYEAELKSGRIITMYTSKQDVEAAICNAYGCRKGDIIYVEAVGEKKFPKRAHSGPLAKLKLYSEKDLEKARAAGRQEVVTELEPIIAMAKIKSLPLMAGEAFGWKLSDAVDTLNDLIKKLEALKLNHTGDNHE